MHNTEADILLIEDNMFDAELTVWMLKKNNIENPIVHISTATVALDFFNGTGEYKGRDVHNKPKVILLDLKIGSVSGIKILEAIKASERLRDIPVLILTGSSQDVDMKKCLELGADSYLVKPINFDSFTKDTLLPILERD